MKKPDYFKDMMVKGAFKSMEHEHHFQQSNAFTEMRDEFYYQVPFGVIGRAFDYSLLKKYMTQLLITRNEVIKKVAEAKSNI